MNAAEINKIVGGLLASLLLLMVISKVGDILYPLPGQGHGEEEAVKAYVVEVPEAAGADEGTAPARSLGELLAAASAENGAKVFKKCTSCHTVEAGGANKVGPNLHDIVGKGTAQTAGFAYSEAMKSRGGTWGYTELDAYLENPKALVPGTKMTFAGLKKPEDRADVILFLMSNTTAPPPLPAP